MGGGPGARRRAGRDRRVRHDRPRREVLPRVRLRARRRLRRRRGRHDDAEGEGGRTSSARRRTSRQREAEPAAVLCTLTVDDHTSTSGRQALHARPRAGARDATASRSSTRTGAARTSRRAGAGPSIGKHILMSVPAARAREGRRGAAGRVPRRAVSRHGRRRRLDAGLRPGEHADPLVKILVCVKRVPMTGGKIVLTDDEQVDRRRGTSASRSARTRSAGSRRRCGSSTSTAARSSC